MQSRSPNDGELNSVNVSSFPFFINIEDFSITHINKMLKYLCALPKKEDDKHDKH